MTIEKLYDHAYNWLITYGPRLLIGIVILFVGLWLIRLLSRWLHNGLIKKDVDPTVKPFLISLLTVALRVLLILVVMQFVGIELTIFTAIVASFGVAAGLALSGTLQNFASGVLILLLKPFVVGDNIISQGLEGTVTSIQIFYTQVKTFDNRTLIVPNGQLSNNTIINMSREGTRRLDISYKFGNAIDVKEVKSVINSTIDKFEDILKEPERRIGVSLLEADGYTLLISVWVNAHGYEDVKLNFQETLLQDIKDAGIKIAGL
jgi:small conductance mechanosensitive channel